MMISGINCWGTKGSKADDEYKLWFPKVCSLLSLCQAICFEKENFEVAYKNDQKNSSPLDPFIFCLWFSHMAVFVNSSETTAPLLGLPPPTPDIPDEGDLITHVSWDHC